MAAKKRRPVETLSRKPLGREVAKLRTENAELRAENAELRAENAELRAENAELRAGNAELRRALAEATLLIEKLTRRVDELEAKLRQTSRNSNKPPSSDPPEAPPRRKKKKSGRKRGGQPGHEGKARALIPTEETDKVVDCKPDTCDGCGVDLVGEDPEPWRYQVTELLKIVSTVTEFRVHSLECSCGVITCGTAPAGAEFAFGPRLQGVVALLTGAFRLSKRNAQALVHDIFGIDIALGSVPNIEELMSAALEKPVEAAKAHIKSQTAEPTHMDETGFRVENQRAWLWAAMTDFICVFVIRASRGSTVAKEILGEAFAGHLVTDRYSAYTWIDRAQRQLCWAHLIRDFLKIEESGRQLAWIGRDLGDIAHRLFHSWHRVRDGTLRRSTFKKHAGKLRKELQALLHHGMALEDVDPRAARFCKELLKLEPAMWAFVRVEGLEPTNNRAERALRHAVIWRKTSFGTQSVRGTIYVERILTAVATLRLQDRNVLEYLVDARTAALRGRVVPSLLPEAKPVRRAA